MLTQVVVPVPGAGASAWVPSTLTLITSAGLSFGAQPDDSVLLCGSNDNTIPVTSATAISNEVGYAGPSNQQNSGTDREALGAWLYYAVIRTGGSTAGLNYNLVGST